MLVAMEIAMIRSLLFLSLAACSVAGCRRQPFFQDAGPLVSTRDGQLVGKYVKVFDTDVAAFLGVPFAQPPLGDLRFARPVPAGAWQGLRRAHAKPPPCMQYSTHNFSFMPTTEPSEDCLYLNVWSPASKSGDKSGDKFDDKSGDKLAVMVWLHGGAFVVGSTDMEVYDGAVLAAYGDVVVVSMNYRLGAFGMLNAGVEEAPGNVGLMDQALALQWVKDNIEQFGGDPDRITLFGESAGSMSISMHLMSPLSRDLFRRGILQSGSMFNPQLADSPEVAVYKTLEFAKIAGCANDTTPMEHVLRCFKSMDALTISKIENEVTRKSIMYFLPSIGNAFLPAAPVSAYESGDFSQKELLVGLVKDEGTVFLPIMLPELFGGQKIDLPQAQDGMRALFHQVPEPALEKIVGYYFQNSSSSEEPPLKTVADALGDFFFVCPTVFLAEKLDDPFFYWMTHQTMKDALEAPWLGVPHFSDVPYVFGVPVIDSKNYTPEEGRFSVDLIRKWTGFAKQGHPLSGSEQGQTWRRFSSSEPCVFELNPRSSKMVTFPRYRVCNELWRSFIVPQPRSIKA